MASEWYCSIPQDTLRQTDALTELFMQVLSVEMFGVFVFLVFSLVLAQLVVPRSIYNIINIKYHYIFSGFKEVSKSFISPSEKTKKEARSRKNVKLLNHQ